MYKSKMGVFFNAFLMVGVLLLGLEQLLVANSPVGAVAVGVLGLWAEAWNARTMLGKFLKTRLEALERHDAKLR